MYIETERTPNPATLKFLAGRTVLASGSAEFASAEAAEAGSPLAAALFGKDLPDTVIAVATGGNVDPATFATALDRFA